jgi:asparagine synthase (glutamine-hydrolysing)
MIRGAEKATVRRAIQTGEPLPGTRGFAGAIDGLVVRDVLGRVPVFVERSDPTTWAFETTELETPRTVPPGAGVSEDGRTELWTLPDPPAATDDSVIERLRAAVRGTIEAVATDGLAIAFSGGVDSAALAGLLDVPLYVVGFPDSHDVRAARTAAAWLGCDLRVVELEHDDLRRAVPAVARATGRTNAMDVQIALGLYLVAERAAGDGVQRLALGQGADELFGGYAKVAKAPEDPRVEADTVRAARRELVETLPAQLERDVLALEAAGVKPVTPLLADDVVSAALRLAGPHLVSERRERKWAFRRAVRAWVPDPVAFREKKAVQYGSLISRELDRLARQAGFKRRMDDHVTRYVESLI